MMMMTTMDNCSNEYLRIESDNDEIRIFEYDKHEDELSESEIEDNTDRFSPVIKDEEVRQQFSLSFTNFVFFLDFFTIEW